MNKAWIVSVNMGYGHQRAAFPLSSLAEEKILTANTDYINSRREAILWRSTQSFYESVSRMKNIPLIGAKIFNAYDKMQDISPFFPFRIETTSNSNVLLLKNFIKQGLCRGLIEHIRSENIPIVHTHFIPALACEYNDILNNYCVITDTDINRIWVKHDTSTSKMIYLTPSRHASMRLIKYGINEENIFLTGFPLPFDNIGENKKILKNNLKKRIIKLDPSKKFINVYKEVLEKELGSFDISVDKKITLAYMVGGAGTQKEIGIKIVKSLKDKIESGLLRIILVAGIRQDIAEYFNKELEKLNLASHNEKVFVLYENTKDEYFAAFNSILHDTDIIWTKPSEMSFYTALGIPIIIAPPVGAHEKFNQQWLQHMGSGFIQENPEFTDDWFFYVLDSGRYAEAAWDGYMHAPSTGFEAVRDVIFKINDYKKYSFNSCVDVKKC